MTEKEIWDVLMKDIQNPYGVAGLMGNLFAESSLNPLCLTGKNNKETGESYVLGVDTGAISCEKFSKDGIAFGLAQWLYWSRKEQLWIFAKEKEASIGDAETQIKFLIKELLTYKTVWSTLLNAKTVKEASDAVMLRYEKPANTSETAKEKRASYGQRMFDLYAMQNSEFKNTGTPVVITTADNVNYRSGNGKKYEIVGRSKVKGSVFRYVATSSDGWHAIVAKVNHKDRVVWISGDFSEVSRI